MTSALVWFSIVALVVIGVIGTVVPALPGAPLIFLATLLAAWYQDFSRIGVGTISASAALTVLVLVTDFVATALGAKRVGASKLAIVGAFAGTLIGVFFLLPGIILGPFIGAVAGELLANRDLLRAGRVGIATWLGLLLGTVVKLGIVFAMIGLLAIGLAVN